MGMALDSHDRGEVPDINAISDEAANQTTIRNNELLYQAGLERLADNPAEAARLQGMNQSLWKTPWVKVKDFADGIDGAESQAYPGVMMTRITPRQALEMAHGERGLRIADRLMDRNVVGQEAPFPIIRSDGGHLDAPIFAFQNMRNGFPDHRVAGLYSPLHRYATWNARHAYGKVPYHEVAGHGLMDGGGKPTAGPWEWDLDPENPEEGLLGRVKRRLERTDQRYLKHDPLNEAAERDAFVHAHTVGRMVGDPSEMRTIGFTLKHDAADVMGIDPVTRQDNDRFLKALLDDYRHYGAEQPTFRQGPRKGEEAPFFNEEQRALKTYFDSLTPEDRKIFKELWFKFGQTGGTGGQAGQSLVV